MLIADYSLGDALLTVLEIFLLVAWFWILITIIGDLFRDHQISGWGKAAWVLVLIVRPLPRHAHLPDRAGRGHARAGGQGAGGHAESTWTPTYARPPASSPADELHKLSELKDKGAISDAEFDRAKAKLLA